MYNRTTAALALCAILGLGGSALAQGTEMPAGQDPATAAGGTEGMDGAANVRESIREGHGVGVPPGAGYEVERGRPVEEAPRRR